MKLKRRERSAKPPKAVSGELVGCCWAAWPGGGWCLRVGGGLTALLVSALLGYAALLFHTKILTLERRLLAGEYQGTLGTVSVQPATSAVDPDSMGSLWIRIRIQKGKNDTQTQKKLVICWMCPPSGHKKFVELS